MLFELYREFKDNPMFNIALFVVLLIWVYFKHQEFKIKKETHAAQMKKQEQDELLKEQGKEIKALKAELAQLKKAQSEVSLPLNRW